jgi:glucose-1-phosphate adenylyltransferase
MTHPDMPSPTVAVVLAGGQGTRLHELTQRDCKPALPFARFHRIVDFAMAGLVRSGIDRILVATQYCPGPLTDHLTRSWAPALPPGGLILRHGPDVAPGAGYQGTANVLRANAPLLDAMGARQMLVLAADHVYEMDFRPLLSAHRASGAPITLAAMPVPRAEASRFGILTAGPGSRIAAFTEKPDQPAAMPGDPAQALASLGIYAVDWPWLRDRLQNPRLQDFGQDVIPQAVDRGEAAFWRWRGYWRDVGTLDSLREAWLDFDTAPTPCRRPLVSGMAVDPPHSWLRPDRFRLSTAQGGLRLMAPLLGPDDPARWAALDRSILMPRAQVGPGVRLTNVIVAPGTIIADGMRIGEDPDEDRRWFRVAGDTVLVTPMMLARRGAQRSRPFALFPRRPGPFPKLMRTT